MKKNTKILKISVLVAYVTMIAVNYLAVALPLGGRSTGQISDDYANLFAPAGYAFSIWGLIYTLLGIYTIYQFRTKESELVGKINQWFLLNALLNASWIFAWHYDFIGLSVLIMLGLLGTLIKIADILRNKDLPLKERWFLKLPFSIYFGWITVATIANITILLVKLDWGRFGFSENFWTVIVLLIGMLIGCQRILKDRSIPFGLVLIWAYSAILYKHLSENGFSGKYPNVIWTIFLCVLVFLGVLIKISFDRKAMAELKNNFFKKDA